MGGVRKLANELLEFRLLVQPASLLAGWPAERGEDTLATIDQLVQQVAFLALLKTLASGQLSRPAR